MKLLHGDIIYSRSSEELAVWENCYLAVDGGIVLGIYPSVPEMYSAVPVTDYGRDLIIPAFSDLHIHAPQYVQRGTGMDLLLPDWLRSCTFPEEAKFADKDYAETIYSLLVEDMIRNGTFHASVYATIHTDTALLLARIMERHGMHGFVGKVNMDRSSPDYLTETTPDSLHETERFLSLFDPQAPVKPILTPRFAPTCTRDLYAGLGKLAARYGCGMQSHIVESRWEAAEAVKLFPECRCDTEIYRNAGLLDNGPSILGHFIFPTESDRALARAYHCTVVHCPDATTNIIAGIAPVRSLTEDGIPVSIGTDVGAGQSVAVYRQIASAIRLSKIKTLYEPEYDHTLSFPAAFCAATRTGGEVFGRYGAFEPGYGFDALVLSGLEDEKTHLSPAARLERFCYIGDDRNIRARYVNGRLLPDRT